MIVFIPFGDFPQMTIADPLSSLIRSCIGVPPDRGKTLRRWFANAMAWQTPDEYYRMNLLPRSGLLERATDSFQRGPNRLSFLQEE